MAKNRDGEVAWFLGLVVVFFVVLILAFPSWFKSLTLTSEEKYYQKAVAEAVDAGVIEQCRNLTDNRNLEIIGKIVVWNLVSDEPVSAVTPKLHYEIRPNENAPELTLVIITNEVHRWVWGYAQETVLREGNKKVADGYKTEATICVVQWPSLKAVGTTKIWSKNPPKIAGSIAKKIYGDLTSPIAEWVNKLYAGEPEDTTETEMPEVVPTEAK